MKQLTLIKFTRREAGRLGYLTTCKRHGKEWFHWAGGQKTASYDMWKCECHGVGLGAYIAHGNPLKGKRHRY